MGNDPFNDALARREIAIIRRQTPDTMQMIGQQQPGNDFERLRLPGELNPLAQRHADILINQKALPAERNHRKKIHPARQIYALIIRHNNIRRACSARQSGLMLSQAKKARAAPYLAIFAIANN